ncbi:D-alanyl-D-alanine carboxypeptidase family protein [Thermodesulfitimonas sp.]
MLCLFALLFMFALGLPKACAAPQIVAPAAVVLDLKTGQVLYAKEATRRMYPASTTKILTALVVLQNAKLDDRICASEEAARTGGSAIWLRKGEELAVRDALYALLLNSANDVATALAEKVGGSVANFVRLMNRTAKACGATDSHFNNPHGLPDENHYTTALDLARITRVAMGNKVFREIVATKTKTIRRSAPENLSLLINHNKLLWRYEGATGVKTGYTTEAGQCIVASAQRDGRELIAVVLGSVGANVWQDAAALLDYGFAAYRLVALVREGQVVGSVPVANGVGLVTLKAARSLWYNIPADEPALTLPGWRLALTPVKAPVAPGQALGELVFYGPSGELGRVTVVAAQGVARQPRWPVMIKGLSAGGGLLLGLAALWAVRKRRQCLFRR